MKKEIYLGGKVIEYDLQYKKVKNINLRIKPDGRVFVSANRFVSGKVIEDFLRLKADFVLGAIECYEKQVSEPKQQYFSEREIREVITTFCEKAYPYFERRGVKYPVIKFRKMVSRWGSCHPVKGVLTFNTQLMYAPAECIEYVVLHEFTHFLQANHSGKFYDELAKTCPEWKNRRKRLKEINIR